ncbi:MAG: hypothetical protein IK139_01650 [Lachnospiraceae bacterium]|nr:hypothetical protein [Lachnospiraceae bacterium]
MGMRGAALSTILGAAVALLLLIPYSWSEKRMLKPALKKALSGIRQVGQVFKAGASRAALYAMTILQFLVLNTIIQNTLGPDYLAIYAVCMNSVTIVRLFAEGVIGLIQNIAGVLYGEKDYFGVRALVKRTAVTVTITAALLLVFFVAFPESMLTLFSFNKMDIYDTALRCVRLFSLSFVFFSANRLSQVYYQSTLQTGLSTLNTVLQGFVLLLPCVCLLMHFMGIEGVCLGVAVTETLTFFAVWVYRMIRQKQGKLPQKGFLMIPDQDSDVLFDTTVSSTAEDNARVIRELADCCNKNGIRETPAKTVCMTAEALIDNISRYGYNIKEPCAVDICLSRGEGELILRIRDDGVPFDPSAYGKEDADIFESSSIEIIKRIASAMSYTRVLNMNNTIIEVSL